MEWSIPLQKLEVGKIQLGDLHNNEKMMVPLAYFDGQNTFNNLNILLPKLNVEEFDIKTGKLVLNIKENKHYETKLQALQNTLLGAVYIQQKYWFPYIFFDIDTLNSVFKPIVDNGSLYLFFPITSTFPIKIYKKGKWYTKYEEHLITSKDTIRVIFRIQGISFHKNNYNNNWSGKFRLQHRIIAILVD